MQWVKTHYGAVCWPSVCVQVRAVCTRLSPVCPWKITPCQVCYFCAQAHYPPPATRLLAGKLSGQERLSPQRRSDKRGALRCLSSRARSPRLGVCAVRAEAQNKGGQACTPERLKCFGTACLCGSEDISSHMITTWSSLRCCLPP